MALKDIIRNFLKFSSEEEREFIVDFSNDEFIKIFLNEDQKQIKIDPEDDNIFTLLSMTNLELSTDNDYLQIGYEQIYDLYYADGRLIDDYKILSLPDFYQGYIKIENMGNFIQDKEVRYSFSFKDTAANYDICTFKNNILQYKNEYRVLEPNMYNLIKYIKDYNQENSSYSNLMKQFESFDKIKGYADESNILLSPRLSNEQRPIIIDKIKVDCEQTEDGLEVYPKVEDKDDPFNRDLLEKFDRGDQIRNFYNVKDGENKRKVIFKNKESAANLKKIRSSSLEDEIKVYELQKDENLDLSDFGPRVKGFGYLNYRANPPSKKDKDRSWFDTNIKKESPRIFTQSGKSFKLEYEDRKRFADAIRKIKEQDKEIIGLDFTNEEGENITISLNENQLSDEIEKINNATIDIDQIRNVEKVEAIKKKLEIEEEREVIELEGLFIKVYSLDYVKNHLRKLNKKNIEKTVGQDDKSKNKSVLIKENLEEEEFVVVPEEKESDRQLEIPRALTADLYSHQKIGVKKLQSLYRTDNLNGLLLADDMGLGKTLQLLTFLAWLKEINKLNLALVVAPTTLINNWDNQSKSNPGEIQKFFPDDFFKTYKIRGRIDDEEKERIKEVDIVFISYTSLRINNIKLGQIHWDVMICDEAQKVKNATTQTSIAVKTQNADFKVACSATPIENNLLDLWNIMDYTLPGILGARSDFRQEFVNELNKISNLERRKELNERLANRIDQNFLRRNKKEELDDLPQKQIEVYGIPANKIEISKIEKLNKLREAGVNHLPLIQKLVALCSHIALIDDSINQDNIKNLISQSSKLKKTKEIINKVKEKNEKVIIFTIFRQMQKILIEAINYWFGFRPSVLNGTIAQNKRQRILDNFRKSEGFNIIILSPEVAGVGIDIVEANHVIHYTRLWNPSKEDQATDRVYRIGQKKDVFVYYPILTLNESYHYQFDSETEYINEYLKQDIIGRSPEEKLNKLLVEKKNLLLNFFFAAGDTDLDWDSVNEVKQQGDYININNIFNILDPYEFEILVAKLYQRQGYEAYPTPKVGDKGADIVAIKDNKLTLIQCKQIKDGKIHATSINEVLGSKNIYSNELNKGVENLVVFTTAKGITKQGKESAKQNRVCFVLRENLAKQLIEHKIYYSEINIDREERYSIEKLKHQI